MRVTKNNNRGVDLCDGTAIAIGTFCLSTAGATHGPLNWCRCKPLAE